uniref:Uncharacterized protein n=1 Tax=Arundo donax TaxID=35708 RepID=A0A0A9HI56_ARUDO
MARSIHLLPSLMKRNVATYLLTLMISNSSWRLEETNPEVNKNIQELD